MLLFDFDEGRAFVVAPFRFVTGPFYAEPQAVIACIAQVQADRRRRHRGVIGQFDELGSEQVVTVVDAHPGATGSVVADCHARGYRAARQRRVGGNDLHQFDVFRDAVPPDANRVHRHTERGDFRQLLGRNAAGGVDAVRGKNDRCKRLRPGAADNVDQRLADRCRGAVRLQAGQASNALGTDGQGEELRCDIAAGHRSKEVFACGIEA